MQSPSRFIVSLQIGNKVIALSTLSYTEGTRSGKVHFPVDPVSYNFTSSKHFRKKKNLPRNPGVSTSAEMSKVTKWKLSQFCSSAADKTVVMLLNRPVKDEAKFLSVWNKAEIRMAVDGGGNRWKKVKEAFPQLLYPQIASGDFDSIKPEVLKEFRDSNVTIVETPDQDETDFTKALRVLRERLEQMNSDQKNFQILAYCDFTGRFDHLMANIETLFHATKILPNNQLLIVGSTSVVWLLSSGSHEIDCQGLDAQHCALIPVGQPTIVTTSGLRWNLTEGKLAFGHLVSTSNELDPNNVERVVKVQTSEPVLWSLDFESEVD